MICVRSINSVQYLKHRFVSVHLRLNLHGSAIRSHRTIRDCRRHSLGHDHIIPGRKHPPLARLHKGLRDLDIPKRWREFQPELLDKRTLWVRQRSVREEGLGLGAPVFKMEDDVTFFVQGETLDAAAIDQERRVVAERRGEVGAELFRAVGVDRHGFGELRGVARHVQGEMGGGAHLNGEDAGGGAASLLVAVAEEAVVAGCRVNDRVERCVWGWVEKLTCVCPNIPRSRQYLGSRRPRRRQG